MLQEVITYIIILCAFAYTFNRLFGIFRRKAHKCSGCGETCGLKEIIMNGKSDK